MAERRMFAKTIIDSDAFLDMPITAQLLYFHLSMRADDDGFINKPKSIMRMIGAKDDDIKMLFSKKFVIPFDSGVVVIKHWKIHNYIRKDSYSETKYKDEKRLLTLDENNAYSLDVTNPSRVCDESVTDVSTQVRIGKDRLGKDRKDSIGQQRFTPPSVEEVRAYCKERRNGIDAQHFIDYYESNGWMVGRNKMKDWKAAVRTWERKNERNTKQSDDANARWGIHIDN